jgi:transcriptional regulator with XRE-family HTH domain
VNKSPTPAAQNFGEFFRSKRIALGLTLRTFCERYGYDPGNISRLERNILPPSLDDEKLTGYAMALQIKQDSQEWVLFHDLAYTAKHSIPKDLRNDNIDFLPAFFRTIRNKKMDKNKLQELIEFLNNPPK